ncbi:MAG: response regulator [Armatimonadetes bacterium]|nr:response regulator [Armatimonadota bacterium]
MPLRALLDRSDIPEDAKDVIREELEGRSGSPSAGAQRLRGQRDLALDLLAAESLDEALCVCLHAALEAAGLDAGGIYLVHPDTRDLELVCHEGASDEWAREIRSVPADSAHGRRVFTGRPTYVTLEQLAALKNPRVVAEGMRALAVIPVVYRDEVIACLNLVSRTDDHISVGRQHTLELISGLLGLVIKRFQVAQDLQQSEERYALATAAGKVAVWDWRPESGEPYCSPRLGEMLGYGPDEVFADWQDWERIRHPDDRERIRAVSRSVSDGPATEFTMEQRLLHKDGSYRWVLSRGTVVRDAESRILRLIGTNTDITEQKQAEEARRQIAARLQQASKLESLGLLAGGVAHDFSNLLTGLLGNIELTRRQIEPASPVHTYLERAEHAALQATDLADQMLAYAGHGHVVVRTLDFAALVSDIGDLAATQFPAGVQVLLSLPHGLPPVRGDATQLRQVALNLVTNAAESVGEAGGIVTVQVGVVDADRHHLARGHVDDNLPEGRYLSLRVSDTGLGMDADTLGRIFDPFFTTKSTGRGFGLASALAVVRGHGGAMLVSSEPGSGTTFEVLLPAVEGVTEPAEPADEPCKPGPQGRGTVLMAEDEPLVLAVATAALSEAGFTVLQAADGSEALRLFQENQANVCAVLLDLAIPKVDGLRVLREIRRLRPAVAVIVTNAYGGDEAVARLQGGGPAAFVRKPYRPEQVVVAVLQALGC